MKTLVETLNYQPHTLSDAEVDHPEAAIAHFFLFHELHESRAALLEFYLAWQYYHADNPQTEEMKQMLFFFTSIVDLVNASYVISYRHEMQKKVV